MVEVLLVIVILAILAGTSAEGYFYFKKNKEFGLNVEQIANSLRKAKIKSETMKEDDAWGVDVQKDEVIVFKGSNFTSRDQSFDEVLLISGITNVSGLSRVVFSKLYGIPSSHGTLILESESGNKNIEINEKGFIKY